MSDHRFVRFPTPLADASGATNGTSEPETPMNNSLAATLYRNEGRRPVEDIVAEYLSPYVRDDVDEVAFHDLVNELTTSLITQAVREYLF